MRFGDGSGRGDIEREMSKNAALLGKFHGIKLGNVEKFIVRKNVVILEAPSGLDLHGGKLRFLSSSWW